MKINNKGEKEGLIHNLHPHQEHLKNGVGRTDDWIEFKTTIKNNDNHETKKKKKIHYLLHTQFPI